MVLAVLSVMGGASLSGFFPKIFFPIILVRVDGDDKRQFMWVLEEAYFLSVF